MAEYPIDPIEQIVELQARIKELHAKLHGWPRGDWFCCQYGDYIKLVDSRLVESLRVNTVAEAHSEDLGR